jgi:transposase-like protein
MRKNQKYSKEEMYLAIELWQESGLSQAKFCSRENLLVKTFSYWYRKYKKEKGLSTGRNKEIYPIYFKEILFARSFYDLLDRMDTCKLSLLIISSPLPTI